MGGWSQAQGPTARAAAVSTVAAIPLGSLSRCSGPRLECSLSIHHIHLYLQRKSSALAKTAKVGAQVAMNPLRNNTNPREDGCTNHLTPLNQDIAPNAIRVALNVLFPWSVAANLRGRKRYPGVYAATVALLRGKAKPDTLKDWCSGRRNAPRWLVGFLDAELAERQRLIQEARIALAAYQFGRGHGAGLRDWWRDKRNREIEVVRKARQAP
jgi:hypothetical protein